MITSSTDALSTAGTFSSRVLTMNPPRSSMRWSFSEPLNARPMGERAVATMTASGIRSLPCRRRPRYRRLATPSPRLLLGRRDPQLRRLKRRPLRPAPSAHGRELAQQLDGAGVVVARAAEQRAVLEHLDDELPPDRRADDGQCPVVVLADAASRDVGVLGRDVGAGLAPVPRPGVALLQRHLVVGAVLHPDLEHALDVHLHHVGLVQAVLRLEQL